MLSFTGSHLKTHAHIISFTDSHINLNTVHMLFTIFHITELIDVHVVYIHNILFGPCVL